MTTIAALIITYNEEENIEDCLESIKWVDEIVVIDSYSEDNTVEICYKYTEKVFLRKFDDFASQRNYGLEKIESDWVLVVDADERVTGELKNEIDSILSSDSDIKAYEIPRKNYFLGRWIKHCGWYPDNTLRLFMTSIGKYRGKVHERPNIKGKIHKLKNPFIHYTYKDIGHYISKMNHYSTLSAYEMFYKGKRKSFIYAVIRFILDFLKKYIFQLGFLDGKPGFFVSFISAVYTFLKYAKLWAINKKK